jgi:hypothetical protein
MKIVNKNNNGNPMSKYDKKWRKQKFTIKYNNETSLGQFTVST